MSPCPLRLPALLPLALLTATALGGCRDTREAPLGVTVRVASSVKAACARVWVRPASGSEQVTEAVRIDGRTELVVAIYPSETLVGEVQVGARGYLANAEGGCDGTPVLNEESAPVQARFLPGEVSHVEVDLHGVPQAFDADGDGFRGAMFGGVDCNDGDASIHPGATELCADGKDNDCNGLPDCADAACDAKSCASEAACTQGSVCQNGTCAGGGPMVCTQTENPCRETSGTCDSAKGGCQYAPRTGAECGDSGLCSAEGECLPAGSEANCANGMDDNGVDGTDCADPSCLGRTCEEVDLCHPMSRCLADGTCDKGPRTVCETPPTECHAPTGTCEGSDGSCVYALKPAGSTCSLGECLGDGRCVASETGAQCGDGLDNDGDGLFDCEDPSCATQACDPMNQCVLGRTCAAAQCQGGSSVMCNAPPSCFKVGTPPCNPASGCNYVPDEGAPCPGGFCSAAGACEPPFSYVPSNFEPLNYAPNDRTDPMVFDNCAATAWIDTGSDSVNPSVDNWCAGVPVPTLHVVEQYPGGPKAVLVATEGLTIQAGNTLGIYGERPIIFAVYGDVTVDGSLLAAGGFGINGPGAKFDACAGAVGGNGGSSGPSNGGGGGGAFATAGGAGGSAGMASAGTPGAPLPALDYLLKPLRGGCSGGYGGKSGAASGRFGGGGGGVQISASGKITLNGRVAATGAGGEKGQGNQLGAGGGGSGGALLIEATSANLNGSGVLSVAGGGGGEGGGSSPGDDGDEGRSLSTLTGPAPGGANGSSSGGDGGAGAWANDPALPGQPGSGGPPTGGGGGGGGGGLGIIRINTVAGCAVHTTASFRGVVSSTGAQCPCSGTGPAAPTHGVCATP